jgi:phage-related protein
MVETLTLPVPPSQSGYTEETTYRVQTAKFGDGYEQRVADGINFQVVNVTLTCALLDSTEKGDLIDFFNARGGYESFYYTLPSEASPRLWVCQDPIQVTSAEANLWNVSFKIREVFDLA